LYNADGSIAEISGNGTRCVAAWMAEELDLQAGDEISIETDAGIRICTIDDFRDSDVSGPTVLVTTDMDVPEFEEKTIELADGTAIEGVYVSMGNPHYVILLGTPESEGFYLAGRPGKKLAKRFVFIPTFQNRRMLSSYAYSEAKRILSIRSLCASSSAESGPLLPRAQVHRQQRQP
jgi:diaminopimelate epimerase